MSHFTKMYTMTPLHIAVEKTDFETVRFFVSRLKNKMPKSESGMSPIHIAAKKGNLEMFKYLIQEVDNKVEEHLN